MTKTKLMGILNATPDSFYDQGKYFDHSHAVARGIQIEKQGADILDIGGESTRPGATSVPEQEELERVIPVIAALKKEIAIPISIDTMKVRVAEAALAAGASLINDVSGFRCSDMQILAAQANVPICVMHMHEQPSTMQMNPFYPEGIIPFLLDWFPRRIEQLLARGVKEKNIILDPGIGFGKTVRDNCEIICHLDKIKVLGFPVLIGLSRKSFLSKITGKKASDLADATLCANTFAIQAGADIIRVHDIAEHRTLLNLLE